LSRKKEFQNLGIKLLRRKTKLLIVVKKDEVLKISI